MRPSRGNRKWFVALAAREVEPWTFGASELKVRNVEAELDAWYLAYSVGGPKPMEVGGWGLSGEDEGIRVEQPNGPCETLAVEGVEDRCSGA